MSQLLFSLPLSLFSSSVSFDGKNNNQKKKKKTQKKRERRKEKERKGKGKRKRKEMVVVDDDDDMVEMRIIMFASGAPSSSSQFSDAYPKRYSLKIPNLLLGLDI